MSLNKESNFFTVHLIATGKSLLWKTRGGNSPGEVTVSLYPLPFWGPHGNLPSHRNSAGAQRIGAGNDTEQGDSS